MNNNQLDNEFDQAFKQDAYTLLNLLYEKNPENFVKQFYNFNQLNKSFFYLLSNTHVVDEKTIDFLMEKGFDFTKDFFDKDILIKQSFYQQHWLTENEYTNNKITRGYSEYLNSAYHLNDVFLLHLTKKINEQNPEYFKKLEKDGYALLHHFIANKPKTFTYLHSIGFSPNLKNNKNIELEEYARNYHSQKSVYSLYNQVIVKDDNEESKDIKKMLDWLDSQNKYLFKNNESEQEKIINFYKENLPKYTQAEQEQLIASTVVTEIPIFWKKVVRSIGINPKNYTPKDYPIWFRLSEMKNQSTFYDLVKHPSFDIRNYVDSDLANNENEKYLIYHLGKYNHKQGITHKRRYDRDQKSLTRKKIYDIISTLITPEFLIEKLPHDKNLNWFQFILSNKNIMDNLKFYINDISANDTRFKNKNEIINFINETWLSLDKNGNTYYENYLSTIRSNNLDYFPRIIDDKFIINNFDCKSKEKVVQLLVNLSSEHYRTYGDSDFYKYFVNIFDDLVKNHQNEIIWDDLFSTDVEIKKLSLLSAKSYDDFISLREFQKLNKILPKSDAKIKANKI